ncbi:hypothetical protein [Hydrogenophaga sp.]|uniref:hypothetical protein n=1 Tax=Hydrogenophaga sp. TaxID=1904254 RepID=UPI00271DD055|nr:hypothetical protein [Hydrogenophaga sp.]MDO9437475.1 hypothetical protein [Hydrogenophaga sp.]
MNGAGVFHTNTSSNFGTGNPGQRIDPYDRRSGAVNRLSAPNSPANTSSAWASQVERVDLRKPAMALAFFDHVAHGRASPDQRCFAQSIFNDLIEHEAYDLFAEVFTAYNRGCQAHAKTSGTPFTTMLELQLPEDWEPSFEKRNDMVEAFRRIQVQQLAVRCFSVDDHEHHVDDYVADGLADHEDDREEDPSLAQTTALQPTQVAAAFVGGPVPAAVSRCVVAMLLEERCGVTELLIEGAMADAMSVSRALPHSRLNAIELGNDTAAPWNRVLTEQELDTYLQLMAGLKTCSTLEHLTLGHRDLVCVSEHIEAFDGPALVSVALVGDSLQLTNDPVDEQAAADQDLTVRFMEAIARFNTLSTVTVRATLGSCEDLSAAFLGPLQGHKSLTQLKILDLQGNHDSPDTTDVLPTVIEFAADCPKLTHFTWATGANPVEHPERTAAEVQRWKERAPRMTNDLEVMKSRLNDKDFPLKFLRLTGMRIPPEDVQVLLGTLSHAAPFEEGSRLEFLDLSEGVLSLRLVHGIGLALRHNNWLKKFMLPSSASNYCFFGADQKLYLLRGSAQEPETFELVFGDDATQEERAAAQQALGKMASLAPLETVPTAPQAQLDVNQKRLQQNKAHNELAVVSDLDDDALQG